MIDAGLWILRVALVIATCAAVALLTVGIADMWREEDD